MNEAYLIAFAAIWILSAALFVWLGSHKKNGLTIFQALWLVIVTPVILVFLPFAIALEWVANNEKRESE